MKKIGEKIRTRRKALKLTQEDVAKRVGVSDVAVGHWERGQNLPRGRNLMELAKVLQMDAGEIVGGKEAKRSKIEMQAEAIRIAYLSASPEKQEVTRNIYGIPEDPETPKKPPRS